MVIDVVEWVLIFNNIFWSFVDGFCVSSYCDVYGLIINGVDWLDFLWAEYMYEILNNFGWNPCGIGLKSVLF
jgi:hypothetical protein